MTGITETSLPSRCDLTAPAMVFGGLFISAIAICSTLDAATPSVTVEPDVLTDEYVIGPQGIDPQATTCEERKSGAVTHKACGKNVTQRSN